ncbi:hypothetical protein shim_09510 [Shimia sp. SK013]|uniref:hypothetical protein n=1 Tax=Shimia sp. SK013 TaxID=1389006 RepID=UPI0006CD3ADE|nr:hypothetical protein [Shimia sp. SK013]KPA22664.1 hypothetical protein shim_09510 [Shimia sp. SK013]
MNPRHFMKMAMWVRRPPSKKRVILVFCVIAICLAIAGIEKLFGLDDILPDLNATKVRIKTTP